VRNVGDIITKVKFDVDGDYRHRNIPLMSPRVLESSLQVVMRKVLIGAGLFLLFGGAVHAEGPTLEKNVTEAVGRLSAFDQSLSFQERKALRQTSKNGGGRFSGALLKKYEEREGLKQRVEDARLMVDLKRRLLDLPGHEDFSSGALNVRRVQEAETVARTIVPAFADLRRQYEMVRPAIFHNLLVNMGIKDQGLCWHWARDLTDRLRDLDLKTFDLIWATARGETMREHNTVVVVSRGHGLEDGLLLDGWKKAGKPFWIRVPDDKKHPWKVGQYYGGR